MSSPDLDVMLKAALDQRKADNQFRQRVPFEHLSPTHCRDAAGRTYVNFASNDYLGVSHHPAVVAAFRDAAAHAGVGAGAAALITGYTPTHAAAEQALARWKGTEAAILLPSGYQANLAAVQAIATVAQFNPQSAIRNPKSPVRFLLDKLSHASLIDAVQATGHPYRVFPHNHLTKLQRLLQDAVPDELQVVVTESIFSMDGDAADLRGFAALKQQHPFLLLLDEAHASGVYGPRGAGLAAHLDLPHLPDLSIVTCSKALGLAGGAVCASRDWCDAVVNFGRASLFTTNVPTPLAAAIIASVGVISSADALRQRISERSVAFRRRIVGDISGGFEGDSPIIPVILGNEKRALAASDYLKSQGLLVLPVRPPTIPKGSSRLRITLSALHTDDEIDRLVSAILAFQKENPADEGGVE